MNAENVRIDNESQRESAEVVRRQNEESRKSAELDRVDNEQLRNSAEWDRRRNENARQDAMDAFQYGKIIAVSKPTTHLTKFSMTEVHISV